MQVFDSLQQLGYSSINIVLVFLFIMIVIYRSFSKILSKQIPRALFYAVSAAAFVFSVNYLAEVSDVANKTYITQKAAEKAAEDSKSN